MKFRWLSAACCIAAFGWVLTMSNAPSAIAQSTKAKPAPAETSSDEDDSAVLTVAIAPIDTFLANVQHLLRQVGAGSVGGGLSGTINQFAGGLDRKRPIGVFVDLDENGQPQAMGCLPVTDVDQFLGQLKAFGDTNDLGDGLYEISLGPQSVYAKHDGAWLYVGQTEDAVSDPPEGIADSLEKLIGKYDIHIQLNPQNIPDTIVSLVKTNMRAGFEQSMSMQQQSMNPDEVATSKAAGEQMLQNIEDLITETEKVVLRLSVMKAEKKTILDVGTKFTAESRFAKQLAKVNGANATLSGIPQDSSAITYQALQLIAPEDLKQIEATVAASLKQAYSAIEKNQKDSAAGKRAKELVQKGTDLLMQTLREGQVEMAGNVSLEGNALNLVSSLSVADGSKVEAFATDLAADANAAKGPMTLQVNVGKHKGVNLHKASIALPKDSNDEARKIFGDTVLIAIGTAPKAVHVAIGKDAEATLKGAIDRVGAKPSGPAELMKSRVILSQVLKFIKSIESNPVVDAMITAAEQATGNDKILVDSKTETDGSVVRLTVEDGVLKAVSAGVKAGNGNRPGF